MRGLRLRAALRSATFLAASVVAAAARPAGAAPDLTLGMIHTSTPYVSSIGLYRFGIVNLGGGPSVGAITVVDTLPAGLSFFDGVGNQGWTVTAADSIVTATFTGTVAAGDSTAFLIEVNVLPPAYPQVFDRATLSGGGDITPENDVTADLMPVSGPADFSIAMSSSTPFIVGFPGWFYVYAVNHGPLATIGALTVTDTLPAGLTFVSAAGTGWVTAGDGQVVTATYAGPVASGASVGFALQVVVAPGAIPSVTNAASISGWADIDATNNLVSDVVDVQEPVARLGLAKHHVGTFVAGLEGTYAFSVTNQGLAPTTAVYAVNDTLAAALTFLGGSGAGWSFAQDGQVVVASRAATLAVGDTADFTLTVAVSAAAPAWIRNAATVRGGGGFDGAYAVDFAPVTPSTAGANGALPGGIALAAPAPNPAGAAGARLAYTLPRDARVSLAVYDATGRLVRTLVDGPVAAGGHEAAWDGCRSSGDAAPSGVFYVRLQAGGVTLVRRLALLR